MKKTLLAIAAIPALLAACAQVPNNPTIDVVPMPGQSWTSFSANRDYCISEAKKRVSADAHRNNTTGILGGIATTVIGAGIGAAAGGGMGAAIGAGSGAFAGAAGGGMYSASGNSSLQQTFNIGYVQCMQATRGQNFVPAYGASQPGYNPQTAGIPSSANGAYYTPHNGPIRLTP